MPNDAKLGLVLGMALVLVIAVVFFRKESANAQPPAQASTIKTPVGTPLPVEKKGPATPRAGKGGKQKAPPPAPLPPPKMEEDLPLPPLPGVD
jgi:hypothetical protein